MVPNSEITEQETISKLATDVVYLTNAMIDLAKYKIKIKRDLENIEAVALNATTKDDMAIIVRLVRDALNTTNATIRGLSC